MYIKDGVLYVVVEGGFAAAECYISETGGLMVTPTGKVMSKKPLGAKPVIASEIIAQLHPQQREMPVTQRIEKSAPISRRKIED